MKGFVPTPERVVDLMVDKLFRDRPPTIDSSVLDPGCGEGAFIEGVIRWCGRRGVALPRLCGVEADPQRAAVATARFAGSSNVRVLQEDFLRFQDTRFDFVIGNPPYVPITGLSIAEREMYRRRYTTAKGRFDLYLLFFEKALRCLKPGGTLVFITPEKFLYVDTARPLREVLRTMSVDELHFLDESTFGELVTYPLVSTVTAAGPSGSTRVIPRTGASSTARLDSHSSWLPSILGRGIEVAEFTLADACERVSCGVATGADSAFVVPGEAVGPSLRRFAHPTISGRQLSEAGSVRSSHNILVPYDLDGHLIPEGLLGDLGAYLREPSRKAQLLARTCVARKPWYAFHENPPMKEILRPKLLCKDITPTPFFVVDRKGTIVPRHSVYYLLPSETVDIDALADHVNSPASREWLRWHCQRAANGFLRLQSQVLKLLPVPRSLVAQQVLSEQLPLSAEAQPA